MSSPTPPPGPLFVSYAVVPDATLPVNTFRFSVTPPPGDPRTFTCNLYNSAGVMVWDMTTTGETTQSSPEAFGPFSGNTLSAHLNVDGGSQPDTVIPLAFADDLATALNQQNIAFTWSAASVQVTPAAPAPLIELDPQGSPVLLSYDVPEPTSFRGRNVIEFDFPVGFFVQQVDPTAVLKAPAVQAKATGSKTTAAKAAAAPAIAPPNIPLPPVTGLSPVYASDTPINGSEVPPTRATEASLTEGRVAGAFSVAQGTGYFDPEVFPNVAAGNDPFTRFALMGAIADLDSSAVVAQLTGGNRLAVYRDTSSRFTYKFIPVPQRGIPTLLLVEYYRLSSFPARYGAGRTIKTFSLLPGEKSKIRVSTYRRSEQSSRQATSILDSNSSEAESDFERSVQAEASSQDSTSKSLEYPAEAEASGSASWGWGSANVTASGGVSGASQASREEFAKNVSNAVTNNATKASSRRDVQVDTSLDIKLEATEEQAVERELENINLSRTLNFVFRQMNQEFITLLHLVDVRVAYFNGYGESRVEVPLPELDDLLNTYILPANQEQVREAIAGELAAITDYTGQVNTTFVQTQTLGSDTAAVSYFRVNPDAVSTYAPAPGAPPVTVPGVIMAADSHVMRTDGVVVDAFLGLGNALDDYAVGIQQQEVRASQLDNDRMQAEINRLNLAMQIIDSGDSAKAQLYQQLFPKSVRHDLGEYYTPDWLAEHVLNELGYRFICVIRF